MNPSSDRQQPNSFQLLYRSLLNREHAFAFPCDAAGHVDIDALGERDRNDYLFARVVARRELSLPEVHPCAAS